MEQVSQLSPELTRGVLQLSRALLAAARTWALYPPEHPAAVAAVARLASAIHEWSRGTILAIGVTPDTLMIEGTLVDTSQTGVAEAAALLHDRDILTLTFIGEIPGTALHAFLRMLALDAQGRRSRGGPAAIWSVEGSASIVIEQVDYQKVLAREDGAVAEPASRDELWRSIVLSISDGHKAVFDERARQRLLAIAGSPADIADLAVAVAAPKCAIDGSPMITMQAATVLAAFRQLTAIVSVAAPERMADVINNVTTAATQLDPHVVMQLLQSEDDPGGVQVVRGMTGAFDDVKVAQLLATALAFDGQASDRLATIFNTIAPDENRKRRVLTLTRNLLSETDFGRSGQFQVLWASTEELLVSYNDKPFVSETYRRELDGVGGRADRMAAGDLPEELSEWMHSLGQDNVRGLSVTMLIDLFTIEDDAVRAAEIADDMEALTDDLLMAGAYDDALTVAQALRKRAATPRSHGQDAARVALDRLGDSLGMRETLALIGDVDDEAWQAIRSVIQTVGVATVEAIKPALLVEQDTPATARAEEQILMFGPRAVGRLASLVGDSRWFVQQRAARLLGRIGTPNAVPLLQPLLRQADARVARQAVSALGAIQDPAAARAIQTVLRAATGDRRKAVTEALVAERDPRVVPMLVRVLEESQPLGRDHDMVLETIDALATVGTDGAVPILTTMARRTSFFGRRKARALKERSIEALVRVGTAKSTTAIKEAAQQGDRMLRKIAAAAGARGWGFGAGG
ncbi:MAG TPA: HEAT repeat domain-containing protein [Vicinamibacterales bacterium]|nr:HEAT repeat domain-containing protein [Vicinamibacterales bacterium]